MANRSYHFHQTDIECRYFEGDYKKFYQRKNAHVYYLLVVLQGQILLEYKDKIVYVKSGDTFFANKNEMFTAKVSKSPVTFFRVSFDGKFFHELDDKIDILKAFSYSEKDRIKIYNKETDFESYKTAVANVIRALTEQKGRSVVIGAVLWLICEIDFIYEKKNKKALLESDSNFAKLYKYIDNHLLENITMKSVSENTFMSEKTITNLMRRHTNNSFRKYITDARLNRAREIIDREDYTAFNKVSACCGFDTYSTFYRAFIKAYGISPKEYKDRRKSTRNPNSTP